MGDLVVKIDPLHNCHDNIVKRQSNHAVVISLMTRQLLRAIFSRNVSARAFWAVCGGVGNFQLQYRSQIGMIATLTEILKTAGKREHDRLKTS